MRVIVALVMAIINCITVCYVDTSNPIVTLMLDYLKKISATCGLGAASTDFISSLIKKSQEMYSGLKEEQVKACIDSFSFNGFPLQEKHKTMLLKLASIILKSPDQFFLCLKDEEHRKILLSQFPNFELSDVSLLCDILPSFLEELYEKYSPNLRADYSLSIKKSRGHDNNLKKELSAFKISLLRAWIVENEDEKIGDLIRNYEFDPCFSSSSISFIKDEIIFDTFSYFLKYNYIDQLREKLKQYNNDIKIRTNNKERYEFEYNSLISTDKSYIELTRGLRLALESHRDKLPHKPIYNKLYTWIRTAVDNDSFQNCFFLTGYFGSGKTRLSLELAKSYFTDRVIFKYIGVNSIHSKEDLVTQISDAYSRFCRFQECINISQSDKDGKLVIILDDIHLMTTKDNTRFSDIVSVVEQFSYNSVKWMLIIQTDYLNAWEKTNSYFTEKHAFRLTRGMEYSSISENWLDLNKRYKSHRVVEQILGCSLNNWGWKKTVENTCYYGPLLACVLVASKKRHPTMRTSLHEFPFIDFCEKYKAVLTGDNLTINKYMQHFARSCWANRSLRIQERSQIDEENACIHLTNCGLMHRDEIHNDLLWGIPDMVWADESSDLSEAIQAITSAIERNQLRTIYNNIVENNYVALVILITFCKKFKKQNRIERIKSEIKQYSESNLFKLYSLYDAEGRNYAVKKIVESFRLVDIPQTFEDVLLSCHLGGLSYDTLVMIVTAISGYLPNIEIAKVRRLSIQIAGIIQANSIVYTDEQILGLLDILRQFEEKLINYFYDTCATTESKAKEKMLLGIFESIGRSLAHGAVNRIFLAEGDKPKYKKKKLKQLLKKTAEGYDGTIVNPCSPLNGEKAPNSIWDFYIEYLCDEIINHEGRDAFIFFDQVFDDDNPHWYDFSQEPSIVRQRRNQLYTLSLGYFFRNYRDINHFDISRKAQEGYIDEYIKIVNSLSSTDEYSHKRLALFMMVHTGPKQYQYNCIRRDDFEPVVKRMLNDNTMFSLLHESTARKFIKTNYGHFLSTSNPFSEK